MSYGDLTLIRMKMDNENNWTTGQSTDRKYRAETLKPNKKTVSHQKRVPVVSVV